MTFPFNGNCCLTRPLSLFTIALTTIPLVGCGSSDDVIPLAPVTGMITREGSPVANAIVEFFPEDGRTSVGKTDENGSYRLMYSDLEGAVIGTCRVQITPGGAEPSAADLESDIVAPPMEGPPTIIQVPDPVTVVEGENEFSFELQEYENSRKATRRKT